MFENHRYNLLLQLIEEQKSLWRIKRMYKKDAGKCKACRTFWQKMQKDKARYIKELQELVKNHIG